jgi:molecular chaperone DnaK
VTAKDKATNNEQKITITSSSGLSKEEIEKMARDAKENASGDQRRKDEIEARNRADNTIYSVEKTLKEHRDKVSEADAKNVEAALEEAKKALQEGGTEKINAAIDKLTQSSHKLAEAMYKATSTPPSGDGAGPGPQGSAEPPPPSGKKTDDVMDAEFVDVEDKKK